MMFCIYSKSDNNIWKDLVLTSDGPIPQFLHSDTTQVNMYSVLFAMHCPRLFKGILPLKINIFYIIMMAALTGCFALS